jgi:hypothetical protein
MASYTLLNVLVRRLTLAMWLSASIFLAQRGEAQSPASAPIRVNPSHNSHQLLSDVAMTSDGRLFVAWRAEPLLFYPFNSPTMLLLRKYSPEGMASQPFVVHRTKDTCCYQARLAADDSEKLVVIFKLSLAPGGGFSVRRYGFTAGLRALWVDTPVVYGQVPEGVALDKNGGFVAVWSSGGQEATDSDLDHGVFARRYDLAGKAIDTEFHINTIRRGDQAFSDIAMSKDAGNFVVVWQSSWYSVGWGVYGQYFSATGERLGGEFLISQEAGVNQEPAVAMDQRGNFVVVWMGQAPLEPAIFAQRFSAGGGRLGGEIRVSDVLEYFPGVHPRVSIDLQGNFVVSWTNWSEGVSMVRLFRADGTPVRSPVPLTYVRGQVDAQVAFADNGTFGAAWTDLGFIDDIEDVYTQRFSASPGNEICMSRPNEFVCDTGRTGGAPEVRYSFGGAAGEPGLLGDIDGDGRDDACFYRKGVFFCDTEHNFGAAETKIRFGQTGDTPLLGDLDHDGKADPCFYRAGRFFCDTAHDGFTAEAEIAFGVPGDLPLLGDVDGDGRADPCVYRAGQFLCDTAHDGGGAEIQVTFGQTGDRPLLGDFDGDGRADPCVYRSGQFLFDTAHDGGAAEATVAFGSGDGVPLLGNLDGL